MDLLLLPWPLWLWLGCGPVSKSRNMPKTECAQNRSALYGVPWLEMFRWTVWSIHHLSFINIFRCVFLRVIIYFFVIFHFHDLSYGATNQLPPPHCLSRKLRDDSLPAITASCPLIESLLLMACSSIGSDGFSSLKGLQNLIVLDLSYTCLMNLEPIFKSCIQLKVDKS